MISKDIQKVLISEDQIEERCEELAKEIENDYMRKEKFRSSSDC